MFSGCAASLSVVLNFTVFALCLFCLNWCKWEKTTACKWPLTVIDTFLRKNPHAQCPTIKLIRSPLRLPKCSLKLEPNGPGLTLMRAVQWPIPGILKAPAPVEELERGVRAGTRSRRSPTPFRIWRANADRGWAGRRERVAQMNEMILRQLFHQLSNTHSHTPLCVCFWPTEQLRHGVHPAGPGSVPDASTRGRCISSFSPGLWPTGPVCWGTFRELKGTLGCLCYQLVS